MPPDVAVVVVTYNSAHVVEELLDSLPEALEGLTAEVVAVDNGSSDATVAVLEGRGDCDVLRSTNHGYSGGINRGVSATTAGAILVVNPDVRLCPGSFRPVLSALQQDGIGIVAPQVRTPQGELDLSLRREPTLLRALGLTGTRLPVFSEYVQKPSAYSKAHIVDWALGAVLLFSRDCFEAVGGWDETFFLYSEETDFCLRARSHGFLTCYEPGSAATHIGGQSGQSDQTHSMQIINRVRLYHRRHGRLAGWLYFALTVFSELSWVLRGQRQSRYALITLLKPSRRPPQLGCRDRFLPA